MDKGTATICLVLNCIPGLAGIGTMVSACVVPGKLNTTALLFGILQWLLQFLLIGYIWSIVHGVWIF